MHSCAVDRDSATPLYIQIRETVVEAIESGKLVPGDKLPSVSLLAKEIGVTPATVRRALKDLGDAGHTECHVGRGTFIRAATDPDGKETKNSAGHGAEAENTDRRNAPPSNPFAFATKRLRRGITNALFDIMPLAHKPGIIQLTRGIPDGDLLPPNFLEEVTEETLAGGSKKFIQATEELGMYELREEIAVRFNKGGGGITPDQVLITNGSLQAVTLVAQAMLEKKPGIICETPCFLGIPDTFSAMGHWVETVQRDEHGPQVAKLRSLSSSAPRLLYLCPYTHNPMGTNLGRERQEELAIWANQTGSIVVADEIFKDLIFEGEAQSRSLLTELGSEQTIIVSSLSKSVMTGLRLGWIISSPGRISDLARLKRLMDHSTPTLIQGMALTILKSGKFDQHTSTMKTLYKKRMATMLKALKRHMPEGVSWTNPAGGFSIFVELPKGYSSVALFLAAIGRGVSFLPGPLFDIDHRYIHALRLSTAWADEHQIKEGVELLADAVKELVSHPPSEPGLSGLGTFQ